MSFQSILRRNIAPPRFVLFAAVLILALAVATVAGLPLQIALLASFDLATLVFLVSLMPVLSHDPPAMRSAAAANDANRVGLLAIAILISAVVLIAVGTLVANRDNVPAEIPLILASLLFAWVFANTVFALHYAHLYYQQSDDHDRGGLDFPKLDTPDYWDFFYFSFTLGMTFQTSDVTIDGAHIRKVALAQSAAAFLFNLGVLALAINIVGSL